MKRLIGVVGASLKMTLRDKVALFWMFMFPIALMLIIGSIFGKSGEVNMNLGIVDLDKSQVSRIVVGVFEDIDVFTVKKGGKNELLKQLRDARLNAVLVISKGFEDSVRLGNAASAQIYLDRSNPTLTQVALNTVRQVLVDVVGRMRGLKEEVVLKQMSVESKELKYLDFIVPGIIAITIMQSALMGLAISLVIYREKGILRRIKVTPIPLAHFLSGELFAALLISLLQSFILLLLGWLVFRIQVNGNLLNIAFIITLGSVAFLSLGFLVSSVSGSAKTAETAAAAINFPMMFLAGVYFPLAMLPRPLAAVAKVLPLYYLGDALREVIIRGKGLGAVWQDILVLVGMLVVCFAASVRFFRWE